MPNVTKLTYRDFVLKTRKIRARELMDNEVVKCYNGDRIGQRGDFVVIDEQDRVMIIKRDRFKTHYEEEYHANQG